MNEYLGKVEQSEFYGEWVHFDNDQEKEEARAYLLSWIKFFMKKNRNYEIVDEPHFVERDYVENFIGKISEIKTLGVKIAIRLKDLNDENMSKML